MFKSTGGSETTFLIRAGVPLYRAQVEAHARDAWRRAEELVRDRWANYVSAGRDTRAGAYAAYLLALEAESAGAGRLESSSQLSEAA
jgi:hypothetical protein